MNPAVITVCAVAALVVLFRLFMRWHMKWLDEQSPVGVWTTETVDGSVTIQFDQDPTPNAKEGTYKQLTETDGGAELKEFGHWWSHRQTLRMLIMASDVPNHPRFGQDTVYSIRYTGPEEITIDGPDRPDLVFRRAPEGTTVEFPEERALGQTDDEVLGPAGAPVPPPS